MKQAGDELVHRETSRVNPGTERDVNKVNLIFGATVKDHRQ